MPYKTLKESVQILKRVGEVQSADGVHLGYEHVSVIHPEEGTILPDSEVSPVVVKLYDEGDSHTLALIERVEEEKPARRTKKEETGE